MFSIHPHIEIQTHVEIHSTSTGKHPDLAHGLSPVSVSNGGFPSAGASGRPSGLLGRLSTSKQTSVKRLGDANSYVVKDPSNTRTPQPLYIPSPETGHLKQTPKMGIYDGNGGVTLDKGMPGGGSGSSKEKKNDEHQPLMSSYDPPTGPFSSARPPNPPGKHSYSDKSAWNDPSTGSSSALPAIPPRNNASISLNPAGFPRAPTTGPEPNPRYLKESGDGQSKYWVIRDGHGGFKPADSSIDKYGTPTHIGIRPGSKLYGKGQWTGPNGSVTPPPTSH